MAIVLTPPRVKTLSVERATPARLRAKVPPLSAISPPGRAVAVSRRRVPPLITRPAVEAVEPAKARVPLVTMVVPA